MMIFCLGIKTVAKFDNLLFNIDICSSKLAMFKISFIVNIFFLYWQR